MGRGIFAVLVWAAIAALSQGHSANIIGNDDRRLIDSQKTFPFTTIVRIHTTLPNRKNFGTCTGALIDRRIVITAAHCVDDVFGRNGDGSTFWISGASIEVFAGIRRNNGRSEFERRSTVQTLTIGGFDNRNQDWALLLLNDPLGDRFGWLGWRSPIRIEEIRQRTNYQNLIMGSVPGDKDSLVYAEYGCRFTDARSVGYFQNGSAREELQLVEHDCDTVGGSSGAPIIQRGDDGKYRLIAVHVSAVTAPNERAPDSQIDRYPNLAVPVETFSGTLQRWKERYD